MSKKAYLILEDGAIFTGTMFGHEAETTGEIVFNTSMSGYQEVLTDPSYNGQIVAMTYPMIGNYGVNDEDSESDRVQVAGFIVKEYCKEYSNHRATSSLDEYLKKTRTTALEGIDTRKLTLHIREKGAMRAGIFFEKEKAVSRLLELPVMEGQDLATSVSSGESYDYEDHIDGCPLIAVYDFGVKLNILRLLKQKGFNVRVYPAKTELQKALKDGARGIFLSNGPGDPDAVRYAPLIVNDIIKNKIPAFGICLGHQIMALGLGGRTYKLKFGHRGANQPVKNLLTGKVEITSQNHGFAVDYDSLKKNSAIEITHINLNDSTVEGLRHKELPIFSVQYHPESNPGPHDSRYLFDEFYNIIAK